MRRVFLLLAAYGVINAIAYSCLLPLWEGFDEAYHYGYVQYLSTNLRLPVLGPGVLSREIFHSFQYQPVSHYLQGTTGAPLNFTEYFAMPPEERARLRQQLESLPGGEKFEPQPDKPNYELNQAPLPYIFMAAIDRVLRNQPLPTRVLWIRLFSSVVAVLLIAHSTFLLSTQLALADRYFAAALFCIFSSQMLYATICHVCNDALAVALTGYLIWAAIRVHQTGSPRDCLWLGLVTSAALLSKAYFLFLTPLALGWIGWALWRRRATLRGAACFLTPIMLLAGPWFVRNLILYHDLSGTMQKTGGLGPRQLLQAAMDLPWVESIVSMAHSSLWTGNNSFTTFSANTLDIMLLLVAAALALYFIHAKSQIAEWTIVAAAVLFWFALLAATITFYAGSKHAAIGAVPWYMQVLLVPVMLLVFLGLTRARRFGRILAPLIVVLWSYVLIATYLIKLVPLYGGFPVSRRIWRELPGLYCDRWGQLNTMLRTVCPASAAVLWIFIGTAVVLSAVLCVRLVTDFLRAQWPR
ncbi:MAG TPA: hypothetical protein VGV35_10825 [Bryobacteraceae bacterium]|nr:hypothetical protein [Bryobacteraceae bacterium]